MLDYQHLSAQLLGILTVNIVYIGEGSAGPGGKNNYDAGNAEVEELFFEIEQNFTDSGSSRISAEPPDPEDRRCPAAGCPVMDKTNENCEDFFTSLPSFPFSALPAPT